VSGLIMFLVKLHELNIKYNEKRNSINKGFKKNMSTERYFKSRVIEVILTKRNGNSELN